MGIIIRQMIRGANNPRRALLVAALVASVGCGSSSTPSRVQLIPPSDPNGSSESTAPAPLETIEDLSAEDAARAAHDALLTPEQLDAWNIQDAYHRGNPYARGILQKIFIDQVIAGSYVNEFMGAPGSPTQDVEPTTHLQLLEGLLAWPLVENTGRPWPIYWKGVSDSAPRVELAWEGQAPVVGAKAFDWQYGLTSSIGEQFRSNFFPLDRAENNDKGNRANYWLGPANGLFGVLRGYSQQEDLPEKPSDAFAALQFGIFSETEARLLALYPRIDFLKKPDNSAVGLLLEATDGERLLIYMEAPFRGNFGYASRKWGWLDGDQAKITSLLVGMEHWESLQEMPVPRISLDEIYPADAPDLVSSEESVEGAP